MEKNVFVCSHAFLLSWTINKIYPPVSFDMIDEYFSMGKPTNNLVKAKHVRMAMSTSIYSFFAFKKYTIC